MKKKMLSFDVSSSTIGWCILSIENNIISYCQSGYIKPHNSNNILENLSFARDEVNKILQSDNFDYIAIEDLVKYMPNTTSTTITVLASFNRMIGLLAYDYLGRNINNLQLIAPISVRHIIKKMSKMTKLPDKKELPNIISSILNFVFPWEFENSKRKRKKIKEENYDKSDAICCGYAAAINIINNK